ncbi:MAG TPA: alpha/beta hydrolase-fold protein, partial [Roseimicrobium sp.]|nr:alpha/beta hydrolase-fold protein [Roseimicrobium sp.]
WRVGVSWPFPFASFLNNTRRYPVGILESLFSVPEQRATVRAVPNPVLFFDAFMSLARVLPVIPFLILLQGAFAAQPKQSQANSDDMWVTSPVPELPTGVTHHTFRSASMKRDVGYCIYLPPGYAADKMERRYPVIYHLHGAGGNETRSVYSAKVLHDGIVSGKLPAIIMVFPNGGRSTMYQDSGDGRFMAETMMIKELLPHIDATCRTIADRKARCIEGFSMGGRGSTHLAMKYPELFGSLFNQSGNVYHVSDPAQLPNAYMGSDPDRLKANDPYLNLQKNLDYIKANLRIQVACGAADPGHLPTVREFHAALTAAGVKHGYFEVEGLDHNQKKMIDGRKDTWFNFQIESLKLAKVPLNYRKP